MALADRVVYRSVVSSMPSLPRGHWHLVPVKACSRSLLKHELAVEAIRMLEPRG